MRIQRPTITQITELKGDGAQLTGSFSGSFNTWEGISGKPDPLLSSSAQIADDISGSLSNTAIAALEASIVSGSSQLADDISGSLSTAHVNTKVPGLLSGSAQIASDISGSFTDTSASIAADIVASNGDISGLNSYTSSLKSAISVAGSDTTILGNLTVQGTQTALDTATLNVADLNILIASGAADSAAANGAGITVGGADATITYQHTGTKWTMNRQLDLLANGLATSGTVSFGEGKLELGAVAITATATELNILDGALLTTTELNYVDGVTSAIQTQLDSKAPTASPTFTGTVSGVTATHVGLGNVTNESKATMFTNPTFTGTVSGVTATHVGLGTSADVQFDSLGIGTAASGTTGEIRATGDITAYYSSDERLKENFKTLDGALDKVNQLNGYEFDWKDGIEDVVSKKGHDIGVKAQEVQALYPELVHERDNGYLAVDYVKLTAVLLHAVKELSAKVDELSK